MSKNIQSIRGMHDFAPAEAQSMRMLENILIQVLHSYAYHEIRTPIVEKLDLFKRSIGEVTDIVEKEMYSFEDRGGDHLALRPEGTASVVRAGIQHGWLHNQQQRYWYLGPYFRRERPQKGRYRQFHQLGVETFGFVGPDIDLELIMLSQSFWQALHVDPSSLQLQINSLGDTQARKNHRKDLIDYLAAEQDNLDEDARSRLHTNPLRIFDSKNPQVQTTVANAPKLLDYLDTEAKDHFSELQGLLDSMQIDYQVNPHLVRGLDYYNRTVFEWISSELGAQGTVCAGGRYDTLVEQMGGRATPAAGFALGIERLQNLVELPLQEKLKTIDAYLIISGEATLQFGLEVVQRIRNELPGITVQMNCGGGSIKTQMKRADRADASLALIIGEEEVAQRLVSVKYLQSDAAQQAVSVDALMELLQN